MAREDAKQFLAVEMAVMRSLGVFDCRCRLFACLQPQIMLPR